MSWKESEKHFFDHVHIQQMFYSTEYQKPMQTDSILIQQHCKQHELQGIFRN